MPDNYFSVDESKSPIFRRKKIRPSATEAANGRRKDGAAQTEDSRGGYLFPG